MIAVTVIWSILAAIWLLDGIRLRGRVAALRRLTPSQEPVSPEHRFVCAPGLELDEATRRAASAHARRERLEVLDLVPADLPTFRAHTFIATLDPDKFRRSRFTDGRTAGYALLASHDVLERADHGDPPTGPAAIFEWAQRLKHLATTTMDFAVAPSLSARGARDDVPFRRVHLRALLGDLVRSVLTVQVLFISAALAGPFLAGWLGVAALALYQLQPLLTFGGTSLRPRDLLPVTLLRAPLDLARITRFAAASLDADAEDPIAARRPRYQALLDGGTDRFFEPRREDCPLCGGRELEPYLETTDLIQGKPGTFVLERCAGCRHLFQNPRLSLAGLDFYYGDFYDGLGEAALESIFAASPEPYLARARMVAGVINPRRWLDVGTGHGHFCWVAREVWPDTRFDGLDLSESIEEAQRRRWVDLGFRGLFPDVAPALEGRYDVVSMSHYLEHTRDPRAEIAAARAALAAGGALFIEVPDPDSKIGTLLGRYWISWFQPQHQHFLSVQNLERVLVEEGFEPVRWHRAEAHQPVDFTIGSALALNHVFPFSDAPWRPARPAGLRFLAGLYWIAAAPVMGVGRLLDAVVGPLFRRPGWSNTYRVVARKRG